MKRGMQYPIAPALPDVKDRLVSLGFESEDSSPEKLAAVNPARLEQVQKIVDDAGISIR